MKKWMIWAGAAIAAGLTLGVALWIAMSSYLQLGTVYKAQATIEEHTPIAAEQFVQEKIPQKNIPADAIQSAEQLNELIGKRTRTMLIPEQVLQKGNVSTANTVREINENMSEKYVTVSIPLDTSDFPIDVIHQNDVVSLISVSKDTTPGSQKILSGYTAENVLVVEAVRDEKAGNNKLIVLVPRNEAPAIEATIVTGKVRVVIDPRKFELKK